MPKASEDPKTLHKAMRYSVFSGGKRIRPIVVLESAKSCGGRISDAIPAASAIELVHTYSLIHDDLPSMDNDDYRRGKLSCHKSFGEAEAILAGDALLTLAFSIIAENYKPKICLNIIKELSEAIGSTGMVGGQALDIAMSNKRIDKRTKALIDRLKTAKLFEVSAKIGAITAGAAKKKIRALRGYGLNLGMAFQAVDDLLDGESRVSRKYAEDFISKAKDALKIFDKKGKSLIKIANGITSKVVA